MTTNYYDMIIDALADFYDKDGCLHYCDKTAEHTLFSPVDNIFSSGDLIYSIEVLATGFDCGALCISWIDEEDKLCSFNLTIDYM